MTIHSTVNSTSGQTMTNNEYQQIHRYRLTCEINTLNAILQKGELDAKHTRHVQQSIAFLTAQLNATVKK
jgi:hypothetical protein